MGEPDFQKYDHRYLGEYQYRFNRRFDLAALLPRMVVAAVSAGKRTERWLRLAEDWCYSGFGITYGNDIVFSKDAGRSVLFPGAPK